MLEWSSRIVPRYQRRTQRIDEAILGVYLSGGNTRRIRGALAPLLKGGPVREFRTHTFRSRNLTSKGIAFRRTSVSP